MSNKKMETDPRQQIQSPAFGAICKCTDSSLDHLPADVKAIRAIRSDHHIPVADIVDVVSGLYPRFDRYLLSKVEHGNKYGIRLRSDAEKALLQRFAPELLGKPQKPHRNKPNRIQARLSDALYEPLQRHIQRTDVTVQDFIEGLVAQFFNPPDSQRSDDMFEIDLPDHPLIRQIERTGYPDGREPGIAYCPICGQTCETIYRDRHGDIFGCGECIKIDDAYDVAECFLDKERSY